MDGSDICGNGGPTTSTSTKSTSTTTAGPTTTTCAQAPTDPSQSTTRPPAPDCTARRWFNTTETRATCAGRADLGAPYPYDEVLCQSLLFYEAEVRFDL